MDRLFLSYTYNPHPDYQQETEELVKQVKVMVDTLELQVLDGLDLGGRAIDNEIRERIQKCDALIAILTPWADLGTGNPRLPPYVETEYQFAMAHDKFAIRVLHETLSVEGMYQANEYILHKPDRAVDTLLKLMRTLAYWKTVSGYAQEVEISPPELGEKFDPGAPGHACDYQLLVNHQRTDWRRAQLWHEPGATFAYLPSVPKESKIRLRLSLGNERWESPFSNLFGRIELARR